jgi:hypothetical protein
VIVSRKELPAWVKPEPLSPNRGFAIFTRDGAGFVEWRFAVRDDGRGVETLWVRIHTRRRNNRGPVFAIPAEVMIAAGVESMRLGGAK